MESPATLQPAFRTIRHHPFLLLASALFSFPVSAQGVIDTLLPATQPPVLRVVIPEQETTRTALVRHRIAANTSPTSRAFVNGKETRVYPTGAFVALIPLPIDTSSVRILVRTANGDSLARTLVFIRSRPPQTSSRDTLTIDTIMMEPSQDMWLGKDDILEVRMKGSPGYEATFEIEGVESGIPMRELPPKEAGGLAGIYVGRYTIAGAEEIHSAPVTFRLRRSFWSSERATSRGQVSILPREFPRVAEIVGRRPFLNVGLGEDRLGGAKLGYLQAGIRVMVIGKVGRSYRVKLSESLTAWLPDDFARLLQPETPLPKSLVGSVSATGTSSEDIVTVGLSQRLPFTSDQQINPTAITVDIFGATSNTNWIAHHLDAAGIRSVRWDQVGSDHYRLTIALHQRNHWGYDVGYSDGTNLRIRIRRPPVPASPDSVLKGKTVVVDPGHGGDNQGALGATGAREMDVALAISKELETQLRVRGARVIMTRKDSAGVTQTDRMDIATGSGALLLISVHCNSGSYSADPERAKGTGTFFRHSGFQPLASQVYDRMLELGFSQFGMVGSFNFPLNSLTQLPNVLVETAFISNPEDEMLLIDPGIQKQIAAKIVEGIEGYVRKYAD